MDPVFDHIHLYSPDPAQAGAWWRDNFGACVELQERGGRKVVVMGFDTGPTLLVSTPMQGQEAPGTGLGKALDHLAFRTVDLDGLVERLRAGGVRIETEPFAPAPGLRVAWARSPEGVRIELVWREGQA